MQRACVQSVSKPDALVPTFEKLFALYSSLKPGVCIRDFCEDNNINALNIDERKFITFGLINGFIRRLHVYPLKLSRKSKKEESLPESIRQLLDGKTSYDEICCSLLRSYEDLDALLRADKDVVFLCK